MTVFLMAVAGVCVLLVGAVNYIKAVIRDKKKVSGRQPQWLYILLQVLLTLSYLLPVVLVSAYSVIVIRQPEYFLGKEWFTWSVVGYFLLIAAAVIVGIVLISKKYNNSHSYSSDQAFMYAVYHRAILSFFVCAVAIAGMIYGLTVFGKFQFKNVVSMSDVDQYYEYERWRLRNRVKRCCLEVTTIENIKILKLLQKQIKSCCKIWLFKARG